MEFINNLKYAWKFAKNQKYLIYLYALSSIVGVILGIVIPILSARQLVHLTDNLLLQALGVTLVIFLCELLRNVVHLSSRYCAQVTYRETFTKIQTELGENILKLNNKTLDENGSGVFIQRLTGDTSRLSDIFNILTESISTVVMDVGIFAAIFIINKWCFLYVASMVLLMFILENKRVKKYNELDKAYRKQHDKTTGFIGELVRGARDIKMLNAEESFMGEFKSRILKLNFDRYDMGNVNRKYIFALDTASDIYDFLLIILCIILIYIGEINVASAIIIVNYSGRVRSMIYYIGRMTESVKDFNLSANRVFEIMEGDNFPKEKFGDTHIEKVNGDFEFKNVKFAYDKEKVLDGLSFKINANETVAFVGKSGAGKTTIFNLLCKMYDVKSGKIFIDGVDIKKLDRETIRGNITIISQDPYIFNVSIKENLRLVKSDATFKDIKEACHLACLDDFIEELPDKYDTIIGEGGVNLSGGQKQRLAIARALIQKTEIILFDEATSALDNETQTKIQKAIDNMKNEYTILIIAHRLSTIINADRILYLENGKIVAEGKHKELLKTCPGYKQLYDAEIKKSK